MIYAIGDIHGCLTALEKLIKKIPLKSGDELLFLGDYVDKGPKSKEVVDYLLKNKKSNWRFLRGNHEQMVLECFKNSKSKMAANWLVNGGYETLKSYVPSKELDEIQGTETHKLLQAHFPAKHAAFFESQALTYETPEYFFCHAGVDLDKPLNQQDPEDLLWIRRRFLEDPRPTPKLVIHGHTPIEKLDLSRDRINLDTGCVYGGYLTALALPSMKVYQIREKKYC